MAVIKCSKCNTEIPARAVNCPKCGHSIKGNDNIYSGSLSPSVAKSKSANDKIQLRLLVLLLISFCLVIAYFGLPEITGHSIGSYFNVLFLRHKLPVLNGDIVVEANSFRLIYFSTDQKWRNIYLNGTIKVSKGGRKDIRVLIMKRSDFNNFSKNRKIDFLYNSGRIVQLDINLDIPPTAEDYVLVLDNTVTTPENKTVNGKVDIIYSSY
jgi:hypothetical protein